MASTVRPTGESEKAGRPAPDRTSAPRRKPDALPRAQAAARRARIVQFVIFAVAAVVTIDALVGEKGLLQTFRARREHARLVGSINAIRHDNARLRHHIRRLREDPAAIEEIARRDLGLIKPGEVLVIIRDAEKR